MMFPAIGASLALKLAVGAVLLALAAGASAYVMSLRATVAEQRVALTETMAALTQEKRTAEHNAAEVSRIQALHKAEVETRRRLEQTAAALRKRTVTVIQEVQRAPTANDPLPDAFDAFLRRMQ